MQSSSSYRPSSLIAQQSWHNQSPDKRPLKRHSLVKAAHGAAASQPQHQDVGGSLRLSGHPDVYPQDPKQEEDKMTNERLTRGYQLVIAGDEFGSLMSLGSTPRQRMEKFTNEGCIVRSADWITSVLERKNQLTTIALIDKKRIKEGTLQNLNVQPPTTAATTATGVAGQSGTTSGKQRTEYQRFFEELATCKSVQRLMKQLQQKEKSKKLYFPLFPTKKREESLDYIYAFKVPLHKALWFLKLSELAQTVLVGGQQAHRRQQQVAQKGNKGSGASNGGGNSGWELYAMNLTKVLTKYLRELLKKIDSPRSTPATNASATTATTAAALSTNTATATATAILPDIQPAHQRWPYFSALYKHLFEEGCVDRMEFLADLVDMLVTESNLPCSPWERPYAFRLLVSLVSQFTSELTQNAWLARRTAYALCRRLWALRAEWDERKLEQAKSPSTMMEIDGAPVVGETPPHVSASEFLRVLVEECEVMRPGVLISLSLLNAIIGDCPVALLWANHSMEDYPDNANHWWLCGSPLDWLQLGDDPTPRMMARLLSQHFQPMPNGDAALTTPASKLLLSQLESIAARSEAIESKWARWPMSYAGPASLLNGEQPRRSGPYHHHEDAFESLVDICLNTLSALDQFSLGASKPLLRLYKAVFCTPTNVADEQQQTGQQQQQQVDTTEMSRQSFLVRIRLLFHWAITAEREGSHRALIVCQLLQLRMRHYGVDAFECLFEENDSGKNSGEKATTNENKPPEQQQQQRLRPSVQDLLLDFLTIEGPVAPDAVGGGRRSAAGRDMRTNKSVRKRRQLQFGTEFANLIHLLAEMQRHKLFNHERYVGALLCSGRLDDRMPIVKKLAPYLPKQAPPLNQKKTSISQADPPLSSISGQPGTPGSKSLSSSGAPASKAASGSGNNNEPAGAAPPSNPAIISFIPTSSVPSVLPAVVSSLASASSPSDGSNKRPMSAPPPQAGFPGSSSSTGRSEAGSLRHPLASHSSTNPRFARSVSKGSVGRGSGDDAYGDEWSSEEEEEESVWDERGGGEEGILLPPLQCGPDKAHQMLTLTAQMAATDEADTDSGGCVAVSMSVHERLLIHTPIEQVEEQRDASNQRYVLLYGVGEERDAARQEIRRLARELCKLWQKRLAVEFFPESKEVRMRRRVSGDSVQELVTRFHALSYHDQWVVSGWCADSLIEQIQDFLQAQCFLLPTMESLDLVCGMMEIGQDLGGLVEFTRELIPLLFRLDEYLLSFRSDLIPGHVTAQLGYVLVGYLAEHFTYFALQPEASSIVNGLYRLVEKELMATGYPISGWARTIAVFVLHAKNELVAARLNDQPLAGQYEVLKAIFPESGANVAPEELKHNPSLLTDLFREPKRFYSYNEYRLRLPSVEDAHTRYSLVVNAILAAKNLGRNYDGLSELATLCSHISAQKPLAGEWCLAVQELCYSTVSAKGGYTHLIREVNVDDTASTHYPLATFIALLAAKYAFSAHALLQRLISNVLAPVIKSMDSSSESGTQSGGSRSPIDGSEMGICLALRITANLLCGTDRPFTLVAENADREGSTATNKSNTGIKASSCGPATPSATSAATISERLLETGRRQITADLRALRIVHLRELDLVLMPLLSALCVLVEALKRRLASLKPSSNASGTAHKLTTLLRVARCTLLVICEQEWVVQRVFRQCESRLDTEALFSCARLRHNSLGQQLLRIALRRRSERHTKRRLMEVCDGGSRKALIDQLLAATTLWNARATYYDLRLMLRESFAPEGCSQKHAQHQAIVAEALLGELGKCCRDLFLKTSNGGRNARRWVDGLEVENSSVGGEDDFRFDQIDCYWLIAPLVAACPRPENIPQTYGGGGQVTVKAKFLKEASTALSVDSTPSPVSSSSNSASTGPSGGAGDGARDSQKDSNCPKQQKERMELQGVRLLAQSPFINMVLTCVQGEDSDQLVGCLLRHTQAIVQRTKESGGAYPHSSAFVHTTEREGLLLRLRLVAHLFDTAIAASNPSRVEAWALVLFQLLQLGVISTAREPACFQLCYDMLASLVLDLIAAGSSGAGNGGSSGSSDGGNLGGVYNAWVKKLRKEMGYSNSNNNGGGGDRNGAVLPSCLAQLLPLQKCYSEWNAWESFAQLPGTGSASTLGASGTLASAGAGKGDGVAGGKGTSSGGGRGADQDSKAQNASASQQSGTASPWQPVCQTTAIRLDRQPSTLQKQLLRTLYNTQSHPFSHVPGAMPDPMSDIFLSPPAVDYVTINPGITGAAASANAASTSANEPQPTSMRVAKVESSVLNVPHSAASPYVVSPQRPTRVQQQQQQEQHNRMMAAAAAASVQHMADSTNMAAMYTNAQAQIPQQPPFQEQQQAQQRQMPQANPMAAMAGMSAPRHESPQPQLVVQHHPQHHYKQQQGLPQSQPMPGTHSSHAPPPGMLVDHMGNEPGRGAPAFYSQQQPQADQLRLGAAVGTLPPQEVQRLRQQQSLMQQQQQRATVAAAASWSGQGTPPVGAMNLSSTQMSMVVEGNMPGGGGRLSNMPHQLLPQQFQQISLTQQQQQQQMQAAALQTAPAPTSTTTTARGGRKKQQQQALAAMAGGIAGVPPAHAGPQPKAAGQKRKRGESKPTASSSAMVTAVGEGGGPQFMGGQPQQHMHPNMLQGAPPPHGASMQHAMMGQQPQPGMSAMQTRPHPGLPAHGVRMMTPSAGDPQQGGGQFTVGGSGGSAPMMMGGPQQGQVGPGGGQILTPQQQQQQQQQHAQRQLAMQQQMEQQQRQIADQQYAQHLAWQQQQQRQLPKPMGAPTQQQGGPTRQQQIAMAAMHGQPPPAYHPQAQPSQLMASQPASSSSHGSLQQQQQQQMMENREVKEQLHSRILQNMQLKQKNNRNADQQQQQHQQQHGFHPQQQQQHFHQNQYR